MLWDGVVYILMFGFIEFLNIFVVVAFVMLYVVMDWINC